MSRNPISSWSFPVLSLVTLLAPACLSRADLGYALPPSGPVRDQKLWCGGSLCRWSVEEGQARPTRVWHDLDPALALVGPRVRLWQDQTVSANRLCLYFNVSVSVPERTRVRLEVDRDSDGAIDFSETLHGGDNSAEDFGPQYRSAFKDDDPREIPGPGNPGQPSRVWMVKEGPDDVETYPRYVTLDACPPPVVDAGP